MLLPRHFTLIMLMRTNNCEQFLSIPDEVLKSRLASDGITSHPGVENYTVSHMCTPGVLLALCFLILELWAAKIELPCLE